MPQTYQANFHKINLPFRDNVLHVDIFYKELVWTSIVQQPSFVALSLLGEVGGFMGLLLGASLLTFFEIIDFIMQNIAQRCSGRKGTKTKEMSNGKEEQLPDVSVNNNLPSKDINTTL